MALYIHLNPQERQQLEALVEQQAADWPVERLQIVLLSDEGKSVQEISQAVHLHPINVRKWIHRFAQHGIVGLRRSKSPGRPRRFTQQQQQRIIELAYASPRRLGLPFALWSLPRLRRYVIEQGVAKHISIETLRRMLQTATRTEYTL